MARAHSGVAESEPALDGPAVGLANRQGADPQPLLGRSQAGAERKLNVGDANVGDGGDLDRTRQVHGRLHELL